MRATSAEVERAPRVVHLLLTTDCNLNCERCFYRRDNPAEMPIGEARRIADELVSAGVKSVAIGGGEPTLYPGLGEVVARLKAAGVYVAVTTNGVVRYDFPAPPDAVHVSFDELHPTGEGTVREAIAHYRGAGVGEVGINHVLTGMKNLRRIAEAFEPIVDRIVVIIEKPESRFSDWPALVKFLKSRPAGKYALDACLAKALGAGGLMDIPAPCRQGRVSMCVDAAGMASRCSNIATKVPYTNLADTWQLVQQQETCIL